MSADSDFFEHRHRDRDRLRPHSNGPSRSVVALRAAEDLLDALADRVAERLVVRLEGLTPAPFEELVDAREIARVTGRSRGWSTNTPASSAPCASVRGPAQGSRSRPLA
jgi:hypothetical protein